MNRPVRRLAVACLLLVLALLANSTYLQAYDAAALRNQPHNVRELYKSYATKRGPIVAGGTEVARSVPTSDQLKYLRTYPGGAEYAAATGYYSYVLGATGVEHAENQVLSGQDDRLFVQRLSDLVTGRKPQGGAAVLTINPKAQDAAWRAMRGKRGAVVALDPSTGAILAFVSSPSYDPSVLTGHDAAKVTASWKRLNADKAQPLLDRAIANTYPPGSLFKVVVSAAALAHGYRPDTVIPAPPSLPLPQSTHRLQNFGGESCSPTGKQTLADALRISCNTAFAALGMRLGGATLRATADAFGFDQSGLDVPMPVATSVFPDHLDPAQTALSAIGQFDVRLTPLEAAMVAGAVADHGVLMKPYLVAKTLAPDLKVLQSTQPQQLSRPMTAQAAAQLTRMMLGVVRSGTGTAAQISGVDVAGKTGTAQSAPGAAPHAWFIAFAPASTPKVAVAVLVEHGGSAGSDATGGRVAAPIARAVLAAVLGR